MKDSIEQFAKFIDVVNRMAQDLQEYADAVQESNPDDPTNPTLDLLNEYDALKSKLGLI